MGDDIQAIKAGILEAGDIFLINKSDRDGAEKTHSDLRLMIDMDQKKYEDGKWKPPILKIEAVFDKGVKEFLEEVEKHKNYLISEKSSLGLRRSKEKVSEELQTMVKNRLFEEVIGRLVSTGDFNDAVNAVVRGDVDPYSACDDLVIPLLKTSDS
jgi:LAO/AO transport system kinase